MIIIPFSKHVPLSEVITYRVSPLFELAASLHVLAQPSLPKSWQPWQEEVITAFHHTGLYREWDYFAPVFTRRIPDVFAPQQTTGVMAVDDQYKYFVTLPADRLYRSFADILEADRGAYDMLPLRRDLDDDPEFVKGRFNLFISSYWQQFFEAKWEEIAPRFVREAEGIEQALSNRQNMVAYLRTIRPDLAADEEQENLTLPHTEPVGPVERLVLHPSYFFIHSPLLECTVPIAHLVYNMNAF
jgi:hypothetical protein